MFVDALVFSLSLKHTKLVLLAWAANLKKTGACRYMPEAKFVGKVAWDMEGLTIVRRCFDCLFVA